MGSPSPHRSLLRSPPTKRRCGSTRTRSRWPTSSNRRSGSRASTRRMTPTPRHAGVSTPRSPGRREALDVLAKGVGGPGVGTRCHRGGRACPPRRSGRRRCSSPRLPLGAGGAGERTARRGARGSARQVAPLLAGQPALDPRFLDGAGYRMRGMLHTKAPHVPLLSGWVDREAARHPAARRGALPPRADQPALLAEAILAARPAMPRRGGCSATCRAWSRGPVAGRGRHHPRQGGQAVAGGLGDRAGDRAPPTDRSASGGGPPAPCQAGHFRDRRLTEGDPRRRATPENRA